jgi:molybdopterin synthase catalytic subunit
MKLTVKLFGALAEAAGRKEDTFDLRDGASAGDVIHAAGARYPHAVAVLERVAVAVNLEVVANDGPVAPDDEVALLPPMSGGAATVTVGLRERPSLDEAFAAVNAPEAGGAVAFVGTVRDHSDVGSVERLDYSAYNAMAERVLDDIATEAANKWGLTGVAVFHAVGSLRVGETTMVVACSAPHRDEAFEGCRYVVDEVKHRVPIWKKEHGPWGERWLGV